MNDDFLFLPDELNYHNDFHGDETAFLQATYDIFIKDFIIKKFHFGDKRINLDSKVGEDSKLSIFWHIVTKDNHLSSSRCLNIPRAQKIPWIKPLLLAVPHFSVKYWKYLEGDNKIRHYIWAESINYVVILEENRSKLYLVSAFCVDPWKKKDLFKKFEKRQQD
jgi:hypothetical protein